MDVRQKLNNATQSIDCTMAKAAKWMGLASLTRLQQVFNVPVHELPPAALRVLHLLLNKAKGDNINQHTRPIKVMSAHIRMLTKILNNKLQKLLPPQVWQYAQHTGYKGASSTHMRRLVYTMVLQCIRRYGGCAVVLLAIAQAYDDVIRQALIKMTKPLGAEVLQVVEEFVKAYDVMRVHVVTAYGLSHWYRQVEGVVQGGGLDPLFYILYVQGMHSELRRKGLGVPMQGATGAYQMPSMGLMDDTVLMHSTMQGLQQLMDVTLGVLRLLGHRCNTKKFALLKYAANRALQAGHARWGAAELKAKLQHQYVRLLGGNINIEGGHQCAHNELKNTCKRLKGSLYKPQPSHPVAQQVVRGVALNKWLFRVQVNIPPQGRISSAVSTLSGLLKTVYHIPQKAPHYAAFDVAQQPHPEYQLRAAVLEDMYKALNSNNRVVADVTIYEMQRPKRGEATDYNKAMQWLRELKVYIKLVASGSKATSTISFRHSPTEYSEAYLFTDASEQLWWGAAYLLVSGEGDILAQGNMRFATECADSSLIESTVIAAVLDALNQHHKRHGARIRVSVWSDSLNAVTQHAHSRYTHKLGHIGDRLVLKTQQCNMLTVQWGWVAAQHDTMRTDVISQYNKQMDEQARIAASDSRVPLWQFPDVWCTQYSVFFMKKGAVIVSVKKFMQRLVHSHWNTRSLHPHRPWVTEVPEATKLTQQWLQVMPYELRVWGFLRCRALYEGYEEWMPQDGMMQMRCTRCQAWTADIRYHRATGCPDVLVAVAWCQERAREHLINHGIPHSRIQIVWGGVVIRGHPGVTILYTHPHQLAHVHQWYANINQRCLPLSLGVGPLKGGSKILKGFGGAKPTRAVHNAA